MLYNEDDVVWTGLSTETKPPDALVGKLAVETDTNSVYQWYGNKSMVLAGGSWVRIVNGGRQITYADNPHEKVVNEHFHLHTGVATTLAAPVTSGDTAITVASAVGFVVGDEVQIENGVLEVTFPTITVIVGAVLTLDRPLDNDFNIGDAVEIVETDVATDIGTLAAPISYKVIPTVGEEWAIARVLIVMVITSAGDHSKFGNLAALVNGVTLRIFRNGVYTTLTNWKANSDIIHDGYDATYDAKSGGGNFGFISRWTFDRLNAEPKIDGTEGDFMEILIQDDITGLVSCQIKAQGHIDD